jgi:DNA-directed RNA polymerase subunit RPC12/RpoP
VDEDCEEMPLEEIKSGDEYVCENCGNVINVKESE